MKSPKQILRDLIERWQMYGSLYDKKHGPGNKPGDAIKRLPVDEREELSKLKAEDIENDRWPYYDGWYDTEEKRNR